jgi:hypothetical protein
MCRYDRSVCSGLLWRFTPEEPAELLGIVLSG